MSHSKMKSAIDGFLKGQMSRRDLLIKAGRYGIGFAALTKLMGMQVTSALAAQDFDWKKHSGTTIKLLMNKHPYMDSMIAELDNFKALTGMNVEYDIFAEDVYFDKVTAALSSGSSEYDAFMTGAYMTWTYGPAGWCADLNEFIGDSNKTNPSYNWNDVVGNLRDACSWSGVAGDAPGAAGSKQWCMPWGFELNSVTYNQRYFDKAGMKPPGDLVEMTDQAEWFTKNAGSNDWSYGIGTRGSRSWATIHPGFMSAYANYGLSDFENNGGKLKAAMNSQASKDFHKQWVKMISSSGPANWSGYTWYEVGNDIGAGASAMIFDADILGYFFNGNPDNKEAGNFGFHGFTPNPSASAPTPNVWIWSLAMSNFSKKKDAAWYWMQWCNGPENAMAGGVKHNQVNPVRESVWASGDFDDKIRGTSPGYMEQYNSSIDGSKIHFTAQPLFFETTTEWAAALQEMQTGSNVDETLDKLASKIDRMMKDVGLA